MSNSLFTVWSRVTVCWLWSWCQKWFFLQLPELPKPLLSSRLKWDSAPSLSPHSVPSQSQSQVCPLCHASVFVDTSSGVGLDSLADWSASHQGTWEVMNGLIFPCRWLDALKNHRAERRPESHQVHTVSVSCKGTYTIHCMKCHNWRAKASQGCKSQIGLLANLSWNHSPPVPSIWRKTHKKPKIWGRNVSLL